MARWAETPIGAIGLVRYSYNDALILREEMASREHACG
jgi:hypothetical protein